MNKKIVIIDSYHQLCRENLCFDPAIEYSGCGNAINVRLAREGRVRGLSFVTADVYLKMASRPLRAVCLTDMVSPFTEELLASGVTPAVCMSLESPLFAKYFYHNIARCAGRFHHNYQFSGTRERLAVTQTKFHSMVFPMDTRVPVDLIPWTKRSYLVLVNSNKRAFSHRRGNLGQFLRSTISYTKFHVYKVIDPWMRIREIYVDRIKAIRFFAEIPGFELYGLGWNESIPGFKQEYVVAARKVWSGPMEYMHKKELLSKFKFALCFENCAFPGYVTEKIFDCFLAGCIPIYFGAPDISDIVPASSFIDYRSFADYSELNRFLSTMSEDAANAYLGSAREFLNSSVAEKFTTDYFVQEVLDIMEEELAT